MVTEDYVSFETAKLLKEKGFPQKYDIYHSMVYNEEDYEDEYEVQRMVVETKIVKAGTLSSYPVGVPDPKCYCPTLQMAMKWLREEKHLQICVSSYSDKWEEYIHGWQFLIKKLTFTEGLGWNWDDSFGAITDKKMSDDMTHKTYEEACEVAIKYCLENLI